MSIAAARVSSFIFAGALIAGLLTHIVTRNNAPNAPAAASDTAENSARRSADEVLASPWVTTTASKVRLESAQSAVGSGHLLLGLHMEMEAGWKTYWHNPGDSGLAPHFDWTGSRNLKAIEQIWPAPRAFDEMGERYYGYAGNMILPLKVTANDPAQPIHLSLKLDYGICSDVCVPARVEMHLEIPAGASEETRHAGMLVQALAQQPLTIEEAGIAATLRLVEIEGHRATLQIVLDHLSPPDVPDVPEGRARLWPDMVIVTGPPGAYFSGSRQNGDRGFLVSVDAGDPAALRGQRVSLVLLQKDGGTAAEGFFLIE